MNDFELSHLAPTAATPIKVKTNPHHTKASTTETNILDKSKPKTRKLSNTPSYLDFSNHTIKHDISANKERGERWA